MTSLSPIVTAVIQLGAVPILLHAWGATKYGDWLILSAVPSYLTFSGLGFGDSSGSDMTMRVAGGDRAGALNTFQSSWALLTAISLLVFTIALSAVWWVPWQRELHLSGVTSSEAALILITLAAWVLSGQQSNILESGYRCDGNFAMGSLCLLVQRFVEAIGGVAVGVMTGSLLAVAVSYLGLRLLGLACYWLLLSRYSPWLTLGFAHVSVATIRRMLRPSFGFIAMPIGNAISIQGFTILVGILLGPVAVTVFSTSRTLTRVGVQMINALGNGIWPELSSAFGAGNLSLARTLHRHAYQASLILAILCAAGLWLFGPAFYHVWVGQAVTLNLACFHILLLATVANSLWYASAIVQMSSNTHSRLAFVYVLSTALFCAAGYSFIAKIGLAGAALAIVLIDIAMCTFVLQTSLKQVDDTPINFLRAVFGSAPSFVRPLIAGLGFKR